MQTYLFTPEKGTAFFLLGTCYVDSTNILFESLFVHHLTARTDQHRLQSAPRHYVYDIDILTFNSNNKTTE